MLFQLPCTRVFSFGAAAPGMLLEDGVLDLRRDWTTRQHCLSPYSEAELAAACHKCPDLLLRLPAVEIALAELVRLGWTRPEAVRMVVSDPSWLHAAAPPVHKARDFAADEYYV